ncbi:MAG: sugar phosphate isomerase/epimerase [Sedimentisphaerales bacterium]|nr:sugar phosphate isomerase/epimerase [Sedimentisphaerales bacterium]
MKCKNWPIGICSWSLQTDIAGVADAMKKIGIEHVHLAIRAAVEENGDNYLAAVQQQNWTISSTMIDFPQEDYSSLDSIKLTGGIAPDDCWERNRRLFIGAVDATVKLGVKYISTHAGFIDESDPVYAQKFIDRITTLADAAGEKDLMLLLETGQETAEELSHFLKELDHCAVGVNFDPANIILYDKGSPIEAVTVLAPWIKHIHIKDAIQTEQPGTWGTEVPWGDGQVGIESFLSVLEEIGFDGVLAIEREAGNDRFGDIKLAAERLLVANQ